MVKSIWKQDSRLRVLGRLVRAKQLGSGICATDLADSITPCVCLAICASRSVLVYGQQGLLYGSVWPRVVVKALAAACTIMVDFSWAEPIKVSVT